MADKVEKERLRIADWVTAKADETEALLKLAAERCDNDKDRKAWNRLFAIKTRVILHVIAEMIRRNNMPLTVQSKDGEK